MCYHLQDIYLFISGLSAQAQDCLQAPTAGARHNVNHRRRPRHRQLAPSQWSPPRPACASSRVSVGFAYERPCMGCNEARSTPLDRSLSLARSLPSHVAWSSAVISDMLALRACVRACVHLCVRVCVTCARRARACDLAKVEDELSDHLRGYLAYSVLLSCSQSSCRQGVGVSVSCRIRSRHRQNSARTGEAESRTWKLRIVCMCKTRA